MRTKLIKECEIDINRRKIYNEVTYMHKNVHLRVQLIKTPNMCNEYCAFPRNEKYHQELLLTGME
jgi:hypothetical protein